MDPNSISPLNNPQGTTRPSYHFKLIKTDTHGEVTKLTYVKWVAVALFVGISVTSFITQGVLVAWDALVGEVDSAVLAGNKLANPLDDNEEAQKLLAGASERAMAERALGSDDSDTGEVGVEGGLIIQEPDTTARNYLLIKGTPFPKIYAQSYLAADLQTGEIIMEQKPGLIAPIASVSKLMTGLIAHEQMNMQKVAIVSRDSYNTYGAQGKLNLGEKIRLYDLMYPLLMESSNDAAEVVADAYDKGHAAFLAEMNKKTQVIGMKNTYYEDPSGLSPKNVSTVRDLLKLGRYIYDKAPVLYDMTRVRQYAILNHQWINQNRYLNHVEFMGGKNGFIDEAKKTTVSLFDIPMARGGKRPVVIVILKSDDREGDALRIMNYLKKAAYFTETVTAQ